MFFYVRHFFIDGSETQFSTFSARGIPFYIVLELHYTTVMFANKN